MHNPVSALSFGSPLVRVALTLGFTLASVVVGQRFYGRHATAADPAVPAAALPTRPAQTRPPQARQNIRLPRVAFADGTGTMGLAPGWRMDLATCAWGAVANGPEAQRVVVATSAPVYVPGTSIARTMHAAGALSAPFGTPADSLRVLGPQLSRVVARNHFPAFVLDNVVEKQPLRPMFPGGRAALVTYGMTERGPRGPIHYRALARIDMVPPTDGFWTLRFTAEVRAPDQVFERDLPLMLAMVRSWQGNDQMMGRRITEKTRAKQRDFNTYQARQRQRSADFDNYIADQQRASDARLGQTDAMGRASNDRLRSANDADEVIRGVRTIEDTQTGQRTSVDLGSVDQIVDGLNDYHHDPDRYRQVPLRDEAEGK